MLNDLKNLFRQTWSSFREELGRREPEDEVAALLAMMRREMVEARAALPQFDDAIRSVQKEVERERRALADTERRGGLAERIGDVETRRVAEEFAARHRDHVAVLEQKLAAAIAERDLRRREVQTMSERYKLADANRFTLLAELRRQRAAGTVRDTLSGGAFADFARMEESIDDTAAYADALQDLDDATAPRPEPPPRTRQVDDRLEELKRRMGKR
jgi:phage shock protein A